MPNIGDVVKILHTALNQTAAIEVQTFIFELENKLHELQTKNLELEKQNLTIKSDLQEKIFQYQSQILELQRTIDRQQKETDNVLDWKKTKSEYEFDNSRGIWFNKSTKMPFCPRCFDRKAETPLRDNGNASMWSYYCPVCNTGL